MPNEICNEKIKIGIDVQNIPRTIQHFPKEKPFLCIGNHGVINKDTRLIATGTYRVTFWPCGFTESIHRLMQLLHDELPLLPDQLMSTVKSAKFKI